MVARQFSLLLSVLIVQNIYGQFVPLGGCGCQQIPVSQTLPVQTIQVANNCGCARNNLPLGLPNGIQYTNTLQIAKSLQNPPCGCVPNLQNSLQLASYGSPCQLANGLQMANFALSQNDLLALLNGIPIPNSQNVLQLSMQALLNQLGSSLPGGQCGCQAGNGFLNANNINLLGSNVYPKPIGLPGQPCSNVQMLNTCNGVPMAGAQDIVVNNAPCQCQSCQNPNPMSFSVY